VKGVEHGGGGYSTEIPSLSPMQTCKLARGTLDPKLPQERMWTNPGGLSIERVEMISQETLGFQTFKPELVISVMGNLSANLLSN